MTQPTPTLTELASTYGSPLYLYDLDTIHTTAHRLQESLPQPSRLHYAVKANPHPAIARELHQAGCGAEISSTGELQTSLDAGHTDFVYTGPGKTGSEVATAIRHGVRRFSIESADQYRTVSDVANNLVTTVDCLLRLNTTRTHGTSGMRMTGAPSQFGIDTTNIEDLAMFAARRGAQVIGLHFFPITNARDTNSLIDEFTHSIRHAARLRTHLQLQVVDLGGGFAAPYAHHGELPDYRTIRPHLEAALDEHLPGWRDHQPEIAFESGRHLVGTAGRLVCTVTDIKTSHGRRYVILDAGINHIGGLAGLGRIAPQPIDIFSDTSRHTDGDRSLATVTGPLCTPADLLARNTHIPNLDIGDLVVIPNVGAYGLTASVLAFLSRPAPIELLLRDGHPVHATQLELHHTQIPIHAATAASA